MKRHRAFTLVEVLVAIGIIALLASILVPTINVVRRQSRAVKCLSNLRQIGLGFQTYAATYDDTFPVAVHLPGGPVPIDEERRWYDLVVPFVSDAKIDRASDIDLIRKNSVIWGCPEWTRIDEYDPNSFADKVRVGYGMQYYPTFFTDGGKLSEMAYIAPGRGRYVPRIQWTKPQYRALILDSTTHIVQTPATMSSGGHWFPYQPVNPSDPVMFYVDGNRHGPQGMKQADSYEKERGLNVLYCDSHAAAASVREAWNAVHNPGEDRAGP